MITIIGTILNIIGVGDMYDQVNEHVNIYFDNE